MVFVKAYASTVIPFSIENVWSMIRNFGDMSWNPAVASVEMESGLPDQVGCHRIVNLANNGGHIREKLLALSDHSYTVDYLVLEAPLPISNYHGHFHLTKITDGNLCFAEWSAEFETETEEYAKELKDNLENVIVLEGFRGVGTKLAEKKA